MESGWRVSSRIRLSKLRLILIVLRSVLAVRNRLRFQKRKLFFFIKNTPKKIEKNYEQRCLKSSRPVLICTLVSFFDLKFLPVPDFF